MLRVRWGLCMFVWTDVGSRDGLVADEATATATASSFYGPGFQTLSFLPHGAGTTDLAATCLQTLEEAWTPVYD